MTNGEVYFATEPSNKVGTCIKALIDRYYVFMNQSGIFRRQWRSQCHYYGVSPSSNAQTDMVRSGGKNGQLAMVKVNHFRNLGQHLVQLTTQQKPAPSPIATNSDAKSQKQTTLAKGILDYYSREKRIERLFRTAAEYAVVGAEAFIQTVWDADASDNKGDIKAVALPSCEVIRDPNKSEYDSLDWVVTREWIDRFKCADKFAPLTGLPEEDGSEEQQDQSKIDELRQTILSQATKMTYDRTRMPMINWMLQSELFGKSDDIAMYHFWHKRTPSVPDGRYVILLEDGTVVMDTKLPYKSIPVRRIATSDIQGTSFGYTPLFDLLVIQEAIDALYSAVATNQMTFGVQLIMAMKGSDIDYKQLSRGLSFLEYSDPNGKPEPLNLTHTPAEVFQFIGQLERAMEVISGVNSVARGDPPESLKSGSALAFVQAQAITFSSNLQSSYASMAEDVYTDIINIIKMYAKDERTITIVGKYNRTMLQSFMGESISEVNRVVVQVASALEQTVPGRMQIAENLIQNKLVTKPEEYLNVIRTGSLEPLLEGDHAELILIKSENEAIAGGQPVSALATDDHVLHIKEHRCILATPESRQDAKVVRLVTDHILEHVKHLSDPGLAPLLAVLGQQSLAAPMELNASAATGPGGEPPDMPNMPKNPATGKQWDPNTGGGEQGPLDSGNPTGGAGGGGPV